MPEPIFVRTQIAPVPPTSAKGLSPTNSPGPSSSKRMASEGELPDVAELIVDAQYDAGGVGSVAQQAGVVRQKSELAVDARGRTLFAK